MNPAPDTPEPLFHAVPGHTRLFRREGGTYYLRAKVPLPLRSIVGKTEIRRSLNTKTLKEALPRVKVESLKTDRLFASAEAKIAGTKPTPPKLSREEIAWAVADFFVKEEARAETWEDNRELSSLSPVEKELVLQTLREDSAAFGGSDAYGPVNASSALDDFLASEGAALGVVKGSEDYRLLLPLFTRAKAEQILRTIDRVEGRPPGQHDSRFALLNSHTPPPPLPRQTIQFGKFLDGFMAYQREAHAQTTPSIPRTDCHSALSSHAVLATANQRPTAETNGCQ